ncbi:MAG: DNA-processing protein DprA [Bacillota bacterium]
MLIDNFGSARAALFADANTLSGFGVTNEECGQFVSLRNDDELERLAQTLTKLSARILTIGAPEYPADLMNIYNAPAVLYCRGELPTTAKIAIVGSRNPTVYGKAAANKLATELAESGLVIVSGAARGIDTVAHTATLAVNRLTIAVLGCGIDVAYPRENAGLLKAITETGAVISEYPPGTEVRPYYFPMRNRIISGLSNSIIVVEAAEKSGALITADFALDQGKDIFAVPGSIFSENSAGCHKLIKNGAKLIDNAKDLIDELQTFVLFSRQCINKITPSFSNNDEEMIFGVLHIDKTMTIDEICLRANVGAKQANVAIFNMLMRGIVREESGKRYLRSN